MEGKIIEMMKIAEQEKVKDPENQIIVTEGEIIQEPRKEGSGRVRIVQNNPEVLDKARSYAESAGMAAHDRRRSEVGRFGSDWKVSMSKVFVNFRYGKIRTVFSHFFTFVKICQRSNCLLLKPGFFAARISMWEYLITSDNI